MSTSGGCTRSRTAQRTRRPAGRSVDTALNHSIIVANTSAANRFIGEDFYPVVANGEEERKLAMTTSGDDANDDDVGLERPPKKYKITGVSIQKVKGGYD